jgi:hypothetical protein
MLYYWSRPPKLDRQKSGSGKSTVFSKYRKRSIVHGMEKGGDMGADKDRKKE